MLIAKDQFKKFVIDSGLVSRADFEAAEKEAAEKDVKTGDILSASGKISKDDLKRIEAYILGIPFVDLSGQKLDFDTLALIPEPIARNHNIVAFRKAVDSLEVAMLDTDDLAAIDFVKKKVGLKILPRLTSSESIKSALLQYHWL